MRLSIALPVVDLPHPLSPTSASVSPGVELEAHPLDRQRRRLAAAEPAPPNGQGDLEVANEQDRLARRRVQRRGGHARRPVRACDGAESRHRLQQLARVAASRGRSKMSTASPPRRAGPLEQRDAVGHLGDDAHVVGDEENGGAELRCKFAHQLEDLRLDGDVEGGRRLVGDQHLRAAARARSRSSRAGACRRKVRADIAPGAAPARRYARRPARAGVRLRAFAARRVMRADRLGQLRARPSGPGLSEVIGSWKIMAISPPRTRRISRSLKRREVAAREPDRSRRCSAPRLGQEAHDRQRRHRLAGAGLAGDAQRLAAARIEEDVVDDRAPALRRARRRWKGRGSRGPV